MVEERMRRTGLGLLGLMVAPFPVQLKDFREILEALKSGERVRARV